jgi:hypothetical protein
MARHPRNTRRPPGQTDPNASAFLPSQHSARPNAHGQRPRSFRHLPLKSNAPQRPPWISRERNATQRNDFYPTSLFTNVATHTLTIKKRPIRGFGGIDCAEGSSGVVCVELIGLSISRWGLRFSVLSELHDYTTSFAKLNVSLRPRPQDSGANGTNCSGYQSVRRKPPVVA